METIIKLPEADRVDLLVGDCLSQLKTLPDQSINTCVTSPPYFGLRDYGVDGQIGLEETPAAFVNQLVEVFREVRRVLRDDGTLWVNIGDSYASFRDGKATPDTSRGDSTGTLVPKGSARNRMASTFKGTSTKHKDLIGIPWRLAFALQDDGWYLRQDIIWSKPNPMPESVKDRCTKSHEYIFLLSKSEKYYFDTEAIKEDAVGARGLTAHGANDGGEDGVTNQRNRRSVWTVATKPFKGAHFATYPEELIKPCILAGCPKDGHVLDPFGGAGTTGLVSADLGRNASLIELNPAYAQIIRERLGHRLKQTR